MLNDSIEVNSLKNKQKTYSKIKPFFKREIARIKGINDIEILEAFTARHPIFVVKPSMRDDYHNRIHHVDVAKGIAILLVVLGHCMHYCGVGQSIINLMIYSFHMPFFFFISGYLYVKSDPNVFFSNKVKSLFLPLVIYQVINVILFSLCWLSGCSEYYQTVCLGGFWFLRTLLMTAVLYFFLDIYLSKIILKDKYKSIALFIICTLLMILGFIYGRTIKNETNQPIATTCVAIFFYFIGNFYREKCEIIKIKKIKDARNLEFVFLGGCLPCNIVMYSLY